MSEVIKRYAINELDDMLEEHPTGTLVGVHALLSGHVLEHEGKRYRLIRADPLPDQDLTDDLPALF